MARGVNKVILVGNLGADPEMKYTPSGTPICTFRLATTRCHSVRSCWLPSRSLKERTEWHRVVAWSKLAEICGQYLAKGRQVYVEGSIRTRSWDDQDGNKRFMTEIVARDVQFLGAGAGGGSAAGGGDFGGPPPLGDDDIPF